MMFEKIEYSMLNAKQKENYNFQKLSAKLADYGFTCMWLNDDWQGADFIALHIKGEHLSIQLKSRLTFDQKYSAREDQKDKQKIYIAFPRNGDWYLYPHDELMQKIMVGNQSSSWENGKYTIGKPSKAHLKMLEQYKLT